MIKLIGYDISKENSEQVFVTISGMKRNDLSIGDEYFMPTYQRHQLGLSEDKKLIITNIYYLNNVPYICCLIKY